MGKHEKKGRGNKTDIETILLVTALIELIQAIITLIKAIAE